MVLAIEALNVVRVNFFQAEIKFEKLSDKRRRKWSHCEIECFIVVIIARWAKSIVGARRAKEGSRKQIDHRIED